MDNRPNLVRYIEDRDLWRFNWPNSKEVNAWIQSFDIDLQVWINEVAPTIESRPLTDIISEGKSLLRQQDKLVKSICYNAKLQRLDEYMAPYVQTNILMSEVCDYMLKVSYPECPFSFYSFERKDGKIQYGLRSRSDFDVSIIAKKYGGGGHKQAAGFEVDKPLF
jgi:nanoRNase/pAp phosphatase (c-di-AMP/oligoRNAs hydrolase)